MHKPQSIAEEIANSLTHGVGAAVALAGTVLLIIHASASGRPLFVVTVTIFGASMILLYTASTLYHAIPVATVKQKLKLLDHIAIYILIAGTYTPFTLIALGGAWGWSIFAVVWALAAAGAVFKVFFVGRYRTLSTAIYVGMGWIVVVAIVPLVRNLETPTLLWLLAGGLAYTTGTFFYAQKSLPFAHSIWHLFVLAGSLFHYVGIWTLGWTA